MKPPTSLPADSAAGPPPASEEGASFTSRAMVRRTRRRFQFSLRTLLLVTVVLSVILAGVAIWVQRARRQAEAVATLSDLGCVAVHEPSVLPNWLVDWLGKDLFCDVNRVVTRRRVAVSEEDIRRFWAAVAELPKMEELEDQLGWSRPGLTKALRNHPRLTWLQLHKGPLSGRLDDDDLEALQGLKQLEFLHLPEMQIGDSGAKFLADLPQLDNVCLRATQIGDDGMAHIAKNRKIRRLQMAETPLGDRGLAEIAKLPLLDNLQIDSTKVTDAGMIHLAQARTLTWLTLSNTQVTDVGVAHLASLPNLQTLDLGGTQVTGIGFKYFGPDSTLMNLVVTNCPINDEGLRAIAQFPQLEQLQFGGASLTDEGLMRLAECPNLKSIKAIRTQITPEGIKRFNKLRPSVSVSSY